MVCFNVVYRQYETQMEFWDASIIGTFSSIPEVLKSCVGPQSTNIGDRIYRIGSQVVSSQTIRHQRFDAALHIPISPLKCVL